MVKRIIFELVVIGAIILFAMIFFAVAGINYTMLATLPQDEPIEECSIKDNKAKDYNLMKALAEAEYKYGVCLGNLMQLVVENDVKYVRTYDKNVVECWKRCNE